MGPPAPTIIRVCPEHLCKLFNENRIWERAESGEFQYCIEPKRKGAAFVDEHGNECWWTDLLFVTDHRFPVGHVRHEVVREANRQRTDAGIIGGSGRWDPSKAYVQIDGRIYGRFKTKGGRKPHCALCEGGDMIHPNARFRESKYRPSTWRYWCVRLRARLRAMINL